MAVWKCKHGSHPYSEIESDCLINAIQEYQELYESDSVKLMVLAEDGKLDGVCWLNVEVEGQEGVFVSRLYRRSIWRGGGVKSSWRKERTIIDVAKELDWKGDPSELLKQWEGEGQWK